ncbi:MAG: hypothetical protein HYY17_03215 [Planctomycetes bacterium]|nr:hypothetical protein [Planctomycetota bacterium]
MRFAVAAAFLACAAGAHAQEAREIAVPNAEVRSGPGSAYSLLGTAHMGERYVVASTSGAWARIFWAGNLGWISTGVADVAAGTGVEIQASTVNVRGSASTSAAIVGHAHAGEVYVRAGISGSWNKIWFGGAARWVSGGTYSTTYELASGAGLEPKGVIDAIASSTTVRSGPGSGYASIGTAYGTQRYVRVGVSGSWHKIWFGHGTGWISAGDTALAADAAWVGVLSFSVYVRSTPNDPQFMGHVHAGQAYARISAANGWIQICYKGAYGWIPANTVTEDATTQRIASWTGNVALSADGRYAAFSSSYPSLVWNDSNGVADIFVADRTTGNLERVSVSTLGAQGGKECYLPPAISGDGRYVLFATASALELADKNGVSDLYLRDRVAGTTTNVTPGANGATGSCAIAADGSCAAFVSTATNLVWGDTNGTLDVFVRPLGKYATTSRASVGAGGAQANGWSDMPAASGDGRYVVFHSSASNLVSGDGNGTIDVFVRDRQAGTTVRASVATGGGEGNSKSWFASISANGRYVAFVSEASNLVWGDTNGVEDVFMRDLLTGVTARVSVGPNGAQGNARSTGVPAISADGRYVSFLSEASNLVPNDTNGTLDAFVHDRQTGETARVSVATGGLQANGGSVATSISADGRVVAFASLATNLGGNDQNGQPDVFLRKRW